MSGSVVSGSLLPFIIRGSKLPPELFRSLLVIAEAIVHSLSSVLRHSLMCTLTITTDLRETYDVFGRMRDRGDARRDMRAPYRGLRTLMISGCNWRLNGL